MMDDDQLHTPPPPSPSPWDEVYAGINSLRAQLAKQEERTSSSLPRSVTLSLPSSPASFLRSATHTLPDGRSRKRLSPPSPTASSDQDDDDLAVLLSLPFDTFPAIDAYRSKLAADQQVEDEAAEIRKQARLRKARHTREENQYKRAKAIVDAYESTPQLESDDVKDNDRLDVEVKKRGHNYAVSKTENTNLLLGQLESALIKKELLADERSDHKETTEAMQLIDVELAKEKIDHEASRLSATAKEIKNAGRIGGLEKQLEQTLVARQENKNEIEKLMMIIATSEATIKNAHAAIERLQRQNSDDSTCSICIFNKRDKVLPACGHAFCTKCIQQVGNCPVCRTEFVAADVTSIYL